RGKEFRLKLLGANLAGVTEVKSHDTRVKAELAKDVEARLGEIGVIVTTPNDLPRGAYELSAVSPNGESARIKLHVDDLPQIYLSGTNEIHTVGALPAAFWGVHEKSGAVDQFDFDAKAGQTLVFDVAARTLGS